MMDREERQRYNDERRKMRDRQRQERNDLRDKEREDLNKLRDEERALLKDERDGSKRREINNKYNKLERETRESSDRFERAMKARHKREKELIDAKYKGKGFLSKFLALGIAAAIGFFLPNYVIKDPELVTECKKHQMYRLLEICVTTKKGSTSKDVILYNPGTLGKSFVDSVGGEFNEKLIKSLGDRVPKIVSINVYPSKVEADANLLDELKSGPLTLYNESYTKFLNVFWPIIEKELEGADRRILMGVSRGGHNAIQIFNNVNSDWDRVVLFSPLLFTCDPYEKDTVNIYKVMMAISTQNYAMLATASEPPQCFKDMPQTGKSMHTGGAVKMVRSYYMWIEEWERNDPMTHMKYVDQKLYIECAQNDDFPFFHPCNTYAAKLKDKGVQVEFVVNQDGHGAFNADSVAGFILE